MEDRMSTSSTQSNDPVLTRDNPPLTRVTKHLSETENAINCKSGLSRGIRDYVQASLSENTRSAYLSDLSHFQRWGGSLPASPESIAEYVVAHADVLSVATLHRRLAALSLAHRAKGLVNPTTAELVKAVVGGLRRIKGTSQRQAQPLLREELFDVLNATGESLSDLRDRALLLIGFAGGFRRAELVALDVDDIEPVRQGIILTLRRSKTDQTGTGRKIGIPHARGRWCPVATLNYWKEAAHIKEGPLFRPISRHGQVGTSRLSGEAVCLIVRARAKRAGLNSPGYSGHSLRAGFATSAALAGVPTWKVRQQTGHASDVMLARYIRHSELFVGNAVDALL